MNQTVSLLIVGLLVLAVVMISGCIKEEIPSAPSVQPKIVIEAYNISVDDVGVDTLYLKSVKVLLRNEGSTSAK